ncbi:MAG: glycosyltransferase [Candidatus Moraniibacteriota bacterium]|jgi:glycosyltransferase involved in cell wall biosynthesis
MSEKIVIGIPCYNEEKTIEKVIRDFQRELPDSHIIVVDNNSSDKTREIAKKAGAEVFFEKKQGKGFAVQKIFNEFDGDILVLIDGDDTYNVNDTHKIIKPILEGMADMVVGDRIHIDNTKAFSNSHWWGNKFLTMSLNICFATKFRDMESGLRAMNKDFVQSTAILAGGFGIEPEIMIQAIERGCIVREIPISLVPRSDGSDSKLNTVKDGTIVLYTVLSLFRDYKPLHFFLILAFILSSLSFVLGWYSLEGYFETGIVSHIPSLVVSGFLILASFISFIAGLILSSIKRRHDELVVLMNRMK